MIDRSYFMSGFAKKGDNTVYGWCVGSTKSIFANPDSAYEALSLNLRRQIHDGKNKEIIVTSFNRV